MVAFLLVWYGHCIFQSSHKAREVMQFNRPPKNCREAFTAEGDQVFERRYYSSDYLRPKFLSKDVETEIRLASCVVFVKSALVDMNSGIVYLSICTYTNLQSLHFLSETYTFFPRILENLFISMPFCDRCKPELYLDIFQLVACKSCAASRALSWILQKI